MNDKNKTKLRFGSVGIINTSLDFGLLFILKYLGIPAIPANIVSTSTAFVFSFFANKKYTFKSNGTNIKREIILFIVVTLFGLWGIQSVIITIILPLIEAMNIHGTIALLAAKLTASVVTIVWNYLMYSRVVFTHKDVEP